MASVPLRDIVDHLDALLDTANTPDYSPALNGLQVECDGAIERVAVAVDASARVIDATVAARANLLIVHHGLFWSNIAPLRGQSYQRIRKLITNGIAVYSSHLPLDRHPTMGNNALLAQRLGLEPTLPFARFQTISVGVAGTCDVPTSVLLERMRALAQEEGGSVTAVGVTSDRETKRWAICTGAGASSDSLREAAALGIDTLIVGEGPHHTGVEALDLGIAVIYGGHYATETLGVKALGAELERRFTLPWSYISSPTGL